jgi:hypothetical protein
MFLTPIPPNVNTTVGAPRRLLCYLECKIAPASESTQGSGGSKFLLTSAPQHWSDGGALPPHRSAKLRRLPVLGPTPCVAHSRAVREHAHPSSKGQIADHIVHIQLSDLTSPLRKGSMIEAETRPRRLQ